MDRKSKAWLAVILVLCLGAVFAWLILESRSPQGQVAQIYLDQKLIEQVDLSQLKESRHLKVESPRGYNLIEFRPGSVAVIEADCPDQICVHQGAIGHSGRPIVCLPHKLVIRLHESPEDTEEGGSEDIDIVVQ